MLFPVQKLIDSLQVGSGMSFAVGLPDGSRHRTGPGEPAFTVIFRTDAALLHSFTRGHLGLLESYFEQSIDVEGDFGAALAAGMLTGLDTRAKTWITAENGLHELRYSNRGLAQAKANAAPLPDARSHCLR